MDMKNCYKILEIQQTASLSEIKQAYRDMIGIWHPDRHAQNPRLHEKATEKLKELNVAYNELITRLTSGIVKSNTEPKASNNEAHLIIVTCPGCQKKNRIKAGFVTRHPRCGTCGILLFQNNQTRQTANGTNKETDGYSRGTDSTGRTSGKKNLQWASFFPEGAGLPGVLFKKKTTILEQMDDSALYSLYLDANRQRR
ncbi:DnaJ domain-containing protein [Thermodesulfobacteriota bacterium]